MQDFLTLWTSFANIVCEFLLTEPVSYFVGVLLLLFVSGLVKRICTI